MSQIVRLGGRSSLLSKIQVLNVKRALSERFFSLDIQCYFRESSGDKDLETPLWQMSESGVFTKDLQADLLENKIDVVIHSYKDLDLRDRPYTKLIPILAREDSRDVLLLKKSKWLNPPEELTILTSSPRREYHIRPFIQKYFPNPINNCKVEILSVRGNVQTRLKKYIKSDVSGIIIAKAALDRILGYTGETNDIPEIREVSQFIREVLNVSIFMILPQSIFPSAPAQGALCAEVRKDDINTISIIEKLRNTETEETTNEERQILSKYGGGCHQKIGVTVLKRAFGKVVFVSGLSIEGKEIYETEVYPKPNIKFLPSEVWPPDGKMAARQRERLTYGLPPKVDILVSKAYAFPLDLSVSPTSQTLWSAGLTTWEELANRGFWVNGTCDGLGETEPISIRQLLGRNENFVKLTHTEADTSQSSFPAIPTYYVSAPEIPYPFDTSKIKAAFWRSGSEFDIVTNRFPELLDVVHFVGPGSTYKKIKRILGGKAEDKLFVSLSFEQWKKNHLIQNG